MILSQLMMVTVKLYQLVSMQRNSCIDTSRSVYMPFLLINFCRDSDGKCQSYGTDEASFAPIFDIKMIES